MDEEDDDFQYNNYEDEDDELFDQVNLDEQTLLKSNEVDNSAIIHENNNGNNNKSFLNDFGAAFAQFNQASQPVILPTQTPQSTSITTTTNTTTTTTTATTASSSASSSHILVHSNQRGNPILSYVKSVPWAYSHLVTLCDYQVLKTLPLNL